MTYKKKIFILGMGFLLACILAYQLSVKKTLKYKSEYENLQNVLESEKEIKQSINQLTYKKAYLDSLVKVHKITTTNLQNELLVSLNEFCKTYSCEVSTFEEPHVDSIGGIENTYNRFSLKGNYKQIIQALYDLEYKKNLGQLVSVHFNKQKDYRRNTFFLTADILIKNTQ